MRGPPRSRPFVTATVLLIAAAVFLAVVTRSTPYVRSRVVSALSSRFQSDVDLTALHVSMFPRLAITGDGLSLRHNGRTDVPPLIRIESFAASAGPFGLMRAPLHLRAVELDRLEISIPPRGARAGLRKAPSPQPLLLIDQIHSHEARVEIVPRTHGKLPRVFEIHDLVMHGFGDEQGATFQAALTNPTPRGRITTQGTFGPWRRDDPGATPVRGRYAFKDADLNTIKGIAGILSSTGAYSGVLERIEVQGETDTPDFAIDLAAQPVHLKTRFQAVVDGTSGDTRLEQVEARLLETVIVARGVVERIKDVKGRKVVLDVTIEDGRIEDVLTLGVKAGQPLITGRLQLETSFLLPAGDRAVIDKLELNGKFSLDRARFTSVNIQQRIDTLSQRGRRDSRGPPTSQGGAPGVVSNLSGLFVLRNGTLRLTDLRFGVPGAVVQMAGTFDLKRDVLDLAGHLLLDASLADTTTGVTSLLARATQFLFRRPGGGSMLPIRISGSRARPTFGLDVRRALTPG